jgi:hypothetical protein
MKKTTIVFVCVLFAFHLVAQKSIDGGYKSYEEFKNHQPAYVDSFLIKKRTTADIKMWGGNDYKIESTNEKVTKKMIKKELWGVCKHDTLYLNAVPFCGLNWYARAEVMGKYWLVRPAFPINSKYQKLYGLNTPQYAYMFGAIGGAIQGMKIAVQRIPVIYSPESGDKMLLSATNLEKLMDKTPNLLVEFNAETRKQDEVILLKYLKKLNDLAQ